MSLDKPREKARIRLQPVRRRHSKASLARVMLLEVPHLGQRERVALDTRRLRVDQQWHLRILSRQSRR